MQERIFQFRQYRLPDHEVISMELSDLDLHDNTIRKREKMKLDPNFLTHVTDGEHYMISTTDTKFNGIVKNNYTAAFIVECLKSDTTESAIVDKMLLEYSNAERTVVEHDVSNIIAKLRSIDAIVE